MVITFGLVSNSHTCNLPLVRVKALIIPNPGITLRLEIYSFIRDVSLIGREEKTSERVEFHMETKSLLASNPIHNRCLMPMAEVDVD